MLKCPQCNSDVQLTWNKYFRAGWKYKITCDSCNSTFKIKLPPILGLSEILFASIGIIIVMITVLILDPSGIVYIEIPLMILAQIPWLLINFIINKSLDSRYGKLINLDDKKD